MVWGTGTPRREFLHVDDLADACLFLMEHYDGDEHINVGTGEDLSIRELAEADPRHRRARRHDHVRHVEAGRHAAQAARRQPAAQLGWRHRIALRDGLASTYEWFCAQAAEERGPRRTRGGRPSRDAITGRRSCHDPEPSLAERSHGSRCGRPTARAASRTGMRSPRRGRAGAAAPAAITAGSSTSTGSSCRADCGCSSWAAATATCWPRSQPADGVGVDFSPAMVEQARRRHPGPALRRRRRARLSQLDGTFDVIVLSDLLHDVWDVQGLLDRTAAPVPSGHARHDELLQPAVGAAAGGRRAAGPRTPGAEAELADGVRRHEPAAPERFSGGALVAGGAAARCRPGPGAALQPRPGAAAGASATWRWRTSCWRGPLARSTSEPAAPRVSVIVPARNEAGNIPAIFARTPEMGGGTELIFVEGHSSDDTYAAIERAMAAHPQRHARLLRQTGRGKGDAVRLGLRRRRPATS